MKIPEGYIEKAKMYYLIPNERKNLKPIPVGDEGAMYLIVMEQMDLDKILATTGIEEEACYILVDYSIAEIAMIFKKVTLNLNKLHAANNKN